MGRTVFLIFAFTLLAFPALAGEFVVKADSVAAVNETVKAAQELPAEERDRFVRLSSIIMGMIIAEQQAKGGDEFNQDEMDARIKQLMHNKTLDDLEAFVSAQK